MADAAALPGVPQCCRGSARHGELRAAAPSAIRGAPFLSAQPNVTLMAPHPEENDSSAGDAQKARRAGPTRARPLARRVGNRLRRGRSGPSDRALCEPAQLAEPQVGHRVDRHINDQTSPRRGERCWRCCCANDARRTTGSLARDQVSYGRLPAHLPDYWPGTRQVALEAEAASR